MLKKTLFKCLKKVRAQESTHIFMYLFLKMCALVSHDTKTPLLSCPKMSMQTMMDE